MGGLSDTEIDFKRKIVIEKLKTKYGEDIEVLDTNFNFPGKSALYYLAKSLEMLCEADLAYFVDEWNTRKGCILEMLCCIYYGIPIEHEFANK